MYIIIKETKKTKAKENTKKHKQSKGVHFLLIRH